MEIKSVSGLVCYVKDLEETVKFYTALGLRLGDKKDNQVRFYINWFWIDFVAADAESKADFLEEARSEHKGAGQYLYLKVDGIDGLYQKLVAGGFKPSSEPRDWPWGNREFVLRDPDGYKLVFFQKI